MTCATARVMVLFLLCDGLCFGQPLSLIVSPIAYDRKLPLSQALAQLGTRVQDGYVVFGIDVRNIPEPEVELNIVEPTRLDVALTQVIEQVSGYGFRSVSEHVIEIYPIATSSSPDDVLNLSVSRFVVSDEPAINIFAKPEKYVPELKDYLQRGKTMQSCGGIGPGLGSTGPGITLNLHGLTLRETLDAVAEADATLPGHARNHSLPVGWVHKVHKDPQGRSVDMWSFISTVPHDWERHRPQ